MKVPKGYLILVTCTPVQYLVLDKLLTKPPSGIHSLVLTACTLLIRALGLSRVDRYMYVPCTYLCHIDIMIKHHPYICSGYTTFDTSIILGLKSVFAFAPLSDVSMATDAVTCVEVTPMFSSHTHVCRHGNKQVIMSLDALIVTGVLNS